MKKLGNENFYSRVFAFLATILFGGLFCAALIYTGSNPIIYDEFVQLNFNNPLMVVSFLLLGALVLLGLNKLYESIIYKLPRNLLLAIFMAAGLLVALSYTLTTATKAQADALSIAAVAAEVNAGISGVYAPDSYIGVYSHQLGFVTILRFFFKIFGEYNYKAIQVVFSFLVPLIMLSGAGIIRILMKENEKLSNRCEFLYLVISFFCLPMYMYVLFIYGDIVYTALTILAAWILLSALDKFSVIKVLLFGLVCGLEYLCKSNSLIVFLAFGITLLISLTNSGKRKSSIFLLLSMIICLIAFPKINDAFYTSVMPGTDAMPSIAWVGMGMNDDYGRAGWNNFYNQIAFAEAGYDGAQTKVRVMGDIRAILGVWAHNPLYMLDFFNRKINLQWNTPLYQGLVMNNAFDPDLQSGIGKLVYSSFSLQLFLERFMKLYQLSMYAVVSLGLFIKRKEKKAISYYCLMIAVFGGFLFSLMWEAKTRYIFPYLIMTLPYFAMNAAYLSDAWKESAGKRRQVADEKGKYNGIDLVKFVMAIMVIVIHTVPYMCVKNEMAVTAIQSFIFCAVPFYFIAAGFLLGNKLWKAEEKVEKLSILKAYLWKILKMYLIWNVVYLPLAIIEYVRNGYTVLNSIILYIRGLLFVGEHYNSWILWYLLSTVFALLVLMAAYKFNIRFEWVMAFGILMFFVAMYGEYIYEYQVGNPKYSLFFAITANTFRTCRVFKGLFYIPLGMWISTRKESVVKGSIWAAIGYLLSLTGLFHDLSLALCSLGIFMIARSIDLKASNIWKILRKMSTVIYLTHMWVYTFVYYFMHGGKKYTVGEFLLTTIITLLIAFVWVEWREKRFRRVQNV